MKRKAAADLRRVRLGLVGLAIVGPLAVPVSAGQLHTVMPLGPNLFAIATDCRLLDVEQVRQGALVRLGDCSGSAGSLEGASVRPFERVAWRPTDKNEIELRIATPGGHRVVVEPVGADGDGFLFCADSCEAEPEEPVANLLRVEGIDLAIPLAGFDRERFIDRSLGYVPSKDIVRDGLPSFGSVRGDWQGRSRKHLGVDIYVDGVDVLASADGTVTQATSGRNSGRHVKIRHNDKVSTVYVHLGPLRVREGDRVRRGQPIGRIVGPSGNAVEPQLHFELQVGGTKVDPYGYIKRDPDLPARLREKISLYEQKLEKAAKVRALLVR